jgi:hypothetical protein
MTRTAPRYALLLQALAAVSGALSGGSGYLNRISASFRACLCYAVVCPDVDLLVLHRAPKRSMNTLSRHEPFPSMLMAMSFSTRSSVNASLVNWMP